MRAFRRKVFYIPGFDPFPPRRYRELYRSESAAQAELSGYTISQNADGAQGWSVQSSQDGRDAETQIKVLVWHDIVNQSMQAGMLATYGQLARTAWIYISSGALWRLAGLRKGPVLAVLYPVGVLLLQLLAAVLIGWLVARLVGAVLPWGGAVVGLLVGWGLLRWFKSLDPKLFAHYLMHDYAFAARWHGANPPALETRMAAFADEIAAALTEDLDEVLVIGHSSGAHLGVSVLADLLRDGRVPEDGPELSFLSLGHVVPMMSFLPQATRLRADLAFLSTAPTPFWVDVTAPGDGCAFALCDPVAVSGVAPARQAQPLVTSAAFTQTLSPDRWAALRWRFFRLHFQYLCAFDRPGVYDYFRITAGPETLRARYAGVNPSPSRITQARNGHTGVAR